MNPTMCDPCARSSRRRGRHRAHRCDGQRVGRTCATVCQCPCNLPSSRFVAPEMSL